jgi:hypothetical protein
MYRVRVSDHIKYGESAVKDCDYYFIIQPNDTYIFLTSPKYTSDGKGYMRVVTYNEAKDFIKSLDDYMIQFKKMTNWYIPENWNRDVKNMKRMTWKEFERVYMDGKENDIKLGIINRIESLALGNIKKGNFESKYPSIEEVYNNMTNSQYNALIVKMETK